MPGRGPVRGGRCRATDRHTSASRSATVVIVQPCGSSAASSSSVPLAAAWRPARCGRARDGVGRDRVLAVGVAVARRRRCGRRASRDGTRWSAGPGARRDHDGRDGARERRAPRRSRRPRAAARRRAARASRSSSRRARGRGRAAARPASRAAARTSAKPASDGSRSKTRRSGRSRRSARLVQTCGVTAFWPGQVDERRRVVGEHLVDACRPRAWARRRRRSSPGKCRGAFLTK